MKRVMIIGSGGSGKSTLAKGLGDLTGLPVYHLDKLFWQPNWVALSREKWEALQLDICKQEEWIVDGNYGATMDLRFAAADTIVFMDLGTLTCLAGAVRRYLHYRGRVRPDIAAGCPERLTAEYITWILSYRKKRRPRIMNRLAELSATKRVVIVRSRRNALEEVMPMATGRDPL